MKFGIIFLGYNVEEYVEQALQPFLGREDCIVSAVSLPFEEYKNEGIKEDKSTEILRGHLERGAIHSLFTEPKFIKEAEARNLALRSVLAENVDFIFLWDADEIATREQVDSIINYVKENPHVWYRISYKNFVFDKQTYLKEPFCPPRIFKVKENLMNLSSFFWDNDIAYNHEYLGPLAHYNISDHATIPQEVAWVDHFTWLNNESSKNKVEYQMKHFGACSYKWNYEKNCLEFNEEYYRAKGENLPEVEKVS